MHGTKQHVPKPSAERLPAEILLSCQTYPALGSELRHMRLPERHVIRVRVMDRMAALPREIRNE